MGASNYTQGTTALFSIDTPLGTDKLLLQGFKGTEGISRLFHFDLNLLSEDSSIDYTDIIGETVTITLNQAGGTPRYISGVISRFGQGGSGETFTSYYAEMVPWLWFLTRNADCQIFQNVTVPNIITTVFQNLGYKDYSDETKGSYQPLEYCVQYRESSFNFVSRLMEEYGIYYFFKHEQGKHTLVLADDSSAVSDCPVQSSFEVDIESTANVESDVITGWRTEYEMRTGKYTLTDYYFVTPSASLLATASTLDSVGGNTSLETFDYPGKYTTNDDGQTLATTRMEEEEALYNVSRGTSNARSMVSGYKFTLTDYYRSDANTSYLLTDIEHNASTDTYGTGKGRGDRYSNAFRCVPASVTYRPLRVTPRPVVYGPQTAVVVGNSGDELTVDKYGRIKVQFFWDRKGQKNASSSCWIRVAQIWAGATWGALFLPRIGQEVIVNFEEGDPDRPIVTGSVYNANMMPPGTLPNNMNISGIRTRSTKSGGTDSANVLTFDDTMGSEVFYMRAEKDMAIRVQNNEDLHVYNNQTITVDQDRTETVTKGNESVTIKQGTRTHTVSGDDSLTVQQGNRSVTVSTGKDTLTVSTGDHVVTVSTGNDTHTVSTGNRSVTVSMGNDSLAVSMGNHSIDVSAGSSSTTAMQSITLTCGGSSITIGPSSIQISSPSITISGDAEVQMSGAMINVEADGILGLTGAMTNINS
jgi:type VI secretion system secreted protein VgrG